MFILFLCVYFISLFDFHISSICTNNIIVMLIRIFFFSSYYLFPVVCLSPIVCQSICVSVPRHPLFLSMYLFVSKHYCMFIFLSVYVTVCLFFASLCYCMSMFLSCLFLCSRLPSFDSFRECKARKRKKKIS